MENKKPRKRYKLKRFGLLYNLLLAFLIVLVIGSSLSIYGYVKLSNMAGDDLGDIDVSEELLALKKDHDVLNIALFGVDSREDSYDDTRSDAIMVLSYNFNTKESFLTSVVRDSYVFIDDYYGYQKINHAYAYGGPALTIKTMNQNFDLDIQDYVAVNFEIVEKLIDAVDGVEVEIKDYELDELNRVILEMNKQGIGTEAETLTDIGTQTLNGKQAVAYMRIRKVGNGDYERMERQRLVITLTVDKLLNYNKFKLIGMVDTFLPYIKTSLSANEIIALGTEVLLGGSLSINQTQLPATELSYGGKLYDGLYYLIPHTLSDNVIQWHNQVYGINNYLPTSTVQQLSQEISANTGLY